MTGIIMILIFVALCIINIIIVQNRTVISKEWDWSIGIYSGQSPYEVAPIKNISNPVLTAADVTDINAEYVADPFMIKKDSIWYMFFEVLKTLTDQGDIGLAVSEDGFQWEYKQIVLDEPFHLSYPYVFEWNNEFYMIPESATANSIRLYKAADFPYDWCFVGVLLEGRYVDSSIVRFNNKWWIFTCPEPYTHDTLRLFYADELVGPWTEHPESPIIEGNAKIARPGGRIIVSGDRLIRFAQECSQRYGKSVSAFEIVLLTENDYNEKEVSNNPVLKAAGLGAMGRIWNRHGMHHIDPHLIDNNRWIACVDGHRKHFTIRIEY